MTLALNAGVPIELVRKVTGHTTDFIVRTKYHNPSNDDLLKQFRERMPAAYGTKNDAAVDKISQAFQGWLQAQCDILLAGGEVRAITSEIKRRLTRAAVC